MVAKILIRIRQQNGFYEIIKYQLNGQTNERNFDTSFRLVRVRIQNNIFWVYCHLLAAHFIMDIRSSKINVKRDTLKLKKYYVLSIMSVIRKFTNILTYYPRNVLESEQPIQIQLRRYSQCYEWHLFYSQDIPGTAIA